MFWTYMRKCKSLTVLAENLAAEDCMRDWKIIIDQEVKPYCALYSDWEIVNLVREIKKKKGAAALPADEMLVGPGRSIDSVMKTFYRLNPVVQKRHQREDDPHADSGVCDAW